MKKGHSVLKTEWPFLFLATISINLLVVQTTLAQLDF